MKDFGVGHDRSERITMEVYLARCGLTAEHMSPRVRQLFPLDALLQQYLYDYRKVRPVGMSGGERKIVLTLRALGVDSEYERPIVLQSCAGRRNLFVSHPDFWVPSQATCIEYLGMEGHAACDRAYAAKLASLCYNGVPVVPVQRRHIREDGLLEEVLRQHLLR